MKSTKKIEEIISPIVVEEACELVDVDVVQQAGQKIVRVFIDKPTGVLMEDCVRVSRAIEHILEVEDPIEGRYNLEVSSPGLNRPLKTKEHFTQVVGKKIDVQTTEKINGRKCYGGILIAVEGNNLIIEIDNINFSVPLNKLAKAHLEYDFEKK
ncbi:MAG: ribosome maturation factor RimP [bacterium]|nr:ribosome maturation factor RimP [bacterium]MBU1916711.1 ribosome maturation factor RimP [bacterium]